MTEIILLNKAAINGIINRVALEHGVEPESIIRRPKKTDLDNIRKARHWAMFTLREVGLTFTTIARMFGGVDCTVVVYAYSKIRDTRDNIIVR